MCLAIASHKENAGLKKKNHPAFPLPLYTVGTQQRNVYYDVFITRTNVELSTDHRSMHMSKGQSLSDFEMPKSRYYIYMYHWPWQEQTTCDHT